MIRLLNVNTLQFEKFFDKETTPEYAIASHRWTEGSEATLQIFEACRGTGAKRCEKVEGFADYIRTDVTSIRYMWIDTCCIDREDVSELGEALNLMFEWYREAELCIVYLADVDVLHNWKSFRRSAWFRRGWTLQELLAPRLVVFYTSSWQVFGNKGASRLDKKYIRTPTGDDLEKEISEITGIPEEVLYDYDTSLELSPEARLAWMNNRDTQRKEDLSYALIGIFGVYLMPNYGEGEQRARYRLLEEISKQRKICNTSTEAVPPDKHGKDQPPASTNHAQAAKSGAKEAKDCASLRRTNSWERYAYRQLRSSSWLLSIVHWLQTGHAIGFIVCICVCFALFGNFPKPTSLEISQLTSPVYSNLNDDCRNLPVIALVGRTGAGKSTFIRVAHGLNGSGQFPEIGETSDSCTREVQLFKATLGNTTICLLDSPGFDDSRTAISDDQSLNDILNKLESISNGDKNARGIIYVIDTLITSYGGLARRHFEIFEQLLGGHPNMHRVALVTSKWVHFRHSTSRFDGQLREIYEKQLTLERDLQQKYWKDMLDPARGSTMTRFRGTYLSAWEIIGKVLEADFVPPSEQALTTPVTVPPGLAADAKPSKKPEPLSGKSSWLWIFVCFVVRAAVIGLNGLMSFDTFYISEPGKLQGYMILLCLAFPFPLIAWAFVWYVPFLRWLQYCDRSVAGTVGLPCAIIALNYMTKGSGRRKEDV